MLHHIPVLLEESIDYLIVNPSGKFLDATAGFGGHSKEILKRLNDDALLVTVDNDVNAFDYLKENLSGDNRVKFYNTNFTNIDNISRIEFIEKYDGILADLGVSSYQLDNVHSGFKYAENAPLDLRMNKNEGIAAKDILNNFQQREIADVLFKYGEEKKSRQFAEKIVEFRKKEKFQNTEQLRRIIDEMTPEPYIAKTLSRIFQALRIYVNNELEALETFLKKAVDLLDSGGRIVVISYHSLEDRIVKEQFKYETLDCVCPPEAPVCTCDKEKRLKILTKKPVTPSKDEISENRRARSAKMRVAEKI
jgi:16S rRNA (cytosine1402-N4)-methyltransferase